MLALAETGSVTQAAAKIHVSQPAVSAALRGVEMTLGTVLFDRRPSGLIATPAGQAVALRIHRALGFLDPALTDLAPQLSRRVTMAQLTALIAVAETESFSAAARQLNLAQPTVHRAVRQFEDEVGRRLFDRTAQGVIPTRATRHLVDVARLAINELEQAKADVADLFGQEVGQLVIGAMPLSRAVLLGPAIAEFRKNWKSLPIRVIEGPYADLTLALRRGDIDMLVGALRPNVTDIKQKVLLYDTMAIVARPDHPLIMGAVNAVDLVNYPWVVAAHGTPSRDHFAAMFAALNLTTPRNLVETGSMTLLCDLVGQSDHLGFVSALQAQRDIANGTLARVPFDPKSPPRPIGVTTRRDWHPTRAQRDMVTALGAVVA